MFHVAEDHSGAFAFELVVHTAPQLLSVCVLPQTTLRFGYFASKIVLNWNTISFIHYAKQFMQKILLTLCAAALIGLPTLASAHERQLFEINGKQYLVVIGSMNEPVSVDDKSGVELRVYAADPTDPMNSSASGVKPVGALEQSLKTDVILGTEKISFPLEAKFRELGAYQAVYYPTVAGMYQYRIYGTIAETPFDVTFSCMAGAHTMSGETNSEVKEYPNGVKRIGQAGMFSCPRERTEVSFPEKPKSAAALTELATDTHDTLHTMGTLAHIVGGASILLSLIALVIAIRSRKRTDNS